MTTYKYKAKNDQDFIVPGIGASKNGILETDHELNEAPALELIETVGDAQPVVSTTPAPTEGQVQAVAEPAPAPAPTIAPINTEVTQ